MSFSAVLLYTFTITSIFVTGHLLQIKPEYELKASKAPTFRI